MVRSIAALVILIGLTACGESPLPLNFSTLAVPPSATPAILSPTPNILPLATTVEAMTPTQTSTPLTETWTPTPPSPTASFLPVTLTPTLTWLSTTTVPANLSVQIADCQAGFDISHGMGEVTNAFALIRNYGKTDLTQVCATLSASDEGRPHPDKTKCVPSLPAGFQVVFKLTVDSSFGKGTSIAVNVTSQEKVTTVATQTSCRDLDLPGWSPDDAGVVQPIP
ncbi:MAG: hypothetical protein ABSB41_11845 [Anaerolineales bacterium]|jgi:hypothetical protein